MLYLFFLLLVVRALFFAYVYQKLVWATKACMACLCYCFETVGSPNAVHSKLLLGGYFRRAHPLYILVLPYIWLRFIDKTK